MDAKKLFKATAMDLEVVSLLILQSPFAAVSLDSR